jgi:hypothetical protein
MGGDAIYMHIYIYIHYFGREPEAKLIVDLVGWKKPEYY